MTVYEERTPLKELGGDQEMLIAVELIGVAMTAVGSLGPAGLKINAPNMSVNIHTFNYNCKLQGCIWGGRGAFSPPFIPPLGAYLTPYAHMGICPLDLCTCTCT